MRTLAIFGTALLVAACASSTVDGPYETSLTLLQPTDQALEQGQTNKITIVVMRRNFDGAVPIEFSGLPAGVEIIESDREIRADDNTRTFTLYAQEDAKPGREVVQVRAEGPEGIATTQTFHLTVHPRS